MHGCRDPRPLARERPRGEDGRRSALLTAAVAAALIQSLDEPEPTTEEVEAAWAEEIQQRLADVDAGVVTPVPWPEARRRVGSAGMRHEGASARYTESAVAWAPRRSGTSHGAQTPMIPDKRVPRRGMYPTGCSNSPPRAPRRNTPSRSAWSRSAAAETRG
ncbi:addiction module protein [Sorangium sp. So ce513]|uniref:addiction module protein n=1 Tax=Sorangium sp. So ce513 TaxID=3133315 RepID=UPI003F5F3241